MTKLTNAPIDEGQEEFEESYKMTRAEYNDRKAALDAAIQGSEAAQRLFTNPDFKLLIIDGYFLQEPARLVGMLASDKLSDDHNRRVLTEELLAIGKLKNRLSTITRNGYQAHEQLTELNEYVGQHGLREV